MHIYLHLVKRELAHLMHMEYADNEGTMRMRGKRAFVVVRAHCYIFLLMHLDFFSE